MKPILTARLRDDIIATAAATHNVAPHAIWPGRSKRRDISRARHDVMLHLYGMGYGVTEIGLVLDRDHTTVSHAVRTITKTKGAKV